MNYVFYKGLLHLEYEPPLNGLIPKFSFIYQGQQRCWSYQESDRNSCFISEDEVPPDLRTQLLLLNP